MTTADYIRKVEVESGHRAATQTRYFLKGLPEHPTPAALDAWRTRLRADTDLSAASINRKISAVRGYLKWAAATERIDIDIRRATDVLTLFREPRPKVELPSPGQVHALVESVTKRGGKLGTAYARFIAICLFAGLRPGEAEALTGDDIRAARYIRVSSTKTGVQRHAYFNHSRVLSYVLPRIAAKCGSGPVLRSGARRWFPKAAGAVGIEGGRNILRKLCASYCACSGKFSDYELAQMFGHTPSVSYEHYRDRQVLEVIRAGGCIEEWLALDDLVEPLIERML